MYILATEPMNWAGAFAIVGGLFGLAAVVWAFGKSTD